MEAVAKPEPHRHARHNQADDRPDLRVSVAALEEVDHPPLRCEVVEPFLGECGDKLEATDLGGLGDGRRLRLC